MMYLIIWKIKVVTIMIARKVLTKRIVVVDLIIAQMVESPIGWPSWEHLFQP